MLQNAQVVGLDAEWKPNTSGEQNPVSILQVWFQPSYTISGILPGWFIAGLVLGKKLLRVVVAFTEYYSIIGIIRLLRSCRVALIICDYNCVMSQVQDETARISGRFCLVVYSPCLGKVRVEQQPQSMLVLCRWPHTQQSCCLTCPS